MSPGRPEDRPRLVGAGCYLDDVLLPPHTVACAFARSRSARARITLRHRPRDVYAAVDLPELGDVPDILEHAGVPDALRWTAGLVQRETPHPVLARDEVLYVGQPIAVAVAYSPAAAVDLALACDVAYEELPPLLDAVAAQAAGAPLLHPAAVANRTVELRMRSGDADAVFAAPDVVVVEDEFSFGRAAGSPMELRGVAACWDGISERLVVWSSTQIPHALRDAIAAVLGLRQESVRVITPDVGGGFGPKALVYPEELVVAGLALRLKTPVKWVETRSEHFVSAIHARDQVHRLAIAARRDGTLLAIRDDFVVDCGAYDLFGKSVPYNTAAHVIGPYHIPNVDIRGAQVLTNKVPAAPYRGSGRPEATFARERCMDRLARRLGMDPIELRRRNLIRNDEMPFDTGVLYRDGAPLVYDGGDYHGCLADALRLQSERELPVPAPGAIRATGVACFVQSGGKGPWESGLVQVQQDGTFLVASGAVSQGQSHESVFARVAAQALGVPVDLCSVRQGDTDLISEGWGTMASRSGVAAGAAIAAAAGAVRHQLDGLARERVGAAENATSVEVTADRHVVVRDESGGVVSRVALAELAREAREPFPLRCQTRFWPPTVTWAFAVHLATIDVHLEHRTVQLVDYVAAYDNGRLLDSCVADQQMIGGIAQGIGGALLEELRYDDAGQLLTLLTDYALPRADHVPPIRLAHRETPTDRNPLGVKGLGESPIVGPAAAIGNALEAALAAYDVRVSRAPFTAQRLHEWLVNGEEDARCAATR